MPFLICIHTSKTQALMRNYYAPSSACSLTTREVERLPDNPRWQRPDEQMRVMERSTSPVTLGAHPSTAEGPGHGKCCSSAMCMQLTAGEASEAQHYRTATPTSQNML